MFKTDHPGTWHRVYHTLRSLGAESFVSWAQLEEITGKRAAQDFQHTIRAGASRSSLARARIELEKVDGLTVGGQSADGFWVWKHEA